MTAIELRNAEMDAYHSPFSAAEAILVKAREQFHYHDSQPFPPGYRMLMRAQYHINCVRCGITPRRKA